jgi:hypothetical protein
MHIAETVAARRMHIIANRAVQKKTNREILCTTKHNDSPANVLIDMMADIECCST